MEHSMGRADFVRQCIRERQMDMEWKERGCDILKTSILLVGALGSSLFIQKQFKTQFLIPMILALAVILVSLLTQGYVYGIVSSLCSVLCLNYAFTFPFFRFNFSIPENMFSAVLMLSLTLITSTLTVKLRRQEKERAEIEKERMRANLLRAVSHDLRTPLTTIYGSSSALIEDYGKLTEEQHIELLEGIREDAQWLIRMVENLLSITRIGGADVKLITTSVVLEELVDSVLVKFRKGFPNQAVEVSLPEEFVCILVDPVLIQQVLGNLLENAVLHAKGMTRLSLNIYRKDGRVIFEVADNGIGIPPELFGNIFTGYHSQRGMNSGMYYGMPFGYEKRDVPVDNQKKSMGIGLSVCATIIKAHGGEITVENLPKGGALFRFAVEECG